MGVHFDTSQVDRLAADLREAPKRVQFKARQTVKKAALEVLRGTRREFSGHSHAPYLQGAFEMEKRGEFGWEIGELDSAGRQWGIAAIGQYGTAQTAPFADIRVPLRKEEPIMMRHLAADVEDAVLGGSE